jgi:hypothetical protein
MPSEREVPTVPMWRPKSALLARNHVSKTLMTLKIIIFWVSIVLGWLSFGFSILALSRRLMGLPSQLGGVLAISLIVYTISILLYIPTFDVCKNLKVHTLYWLLFLSGVLVYFIWGE